MTQSKAKKTPRKNRHLSIKKEPSSAVLLPAFVDIVVNVSAAGSEVLQPVFTHRDKHTTTAVIVAQHLSSSFKCKTTAGLKISQARPGISCSFGAVA